MKRFAIILMMFLASFAHADYYGSWKIDDNVTFMANLHRFSSGAEYAATGDVDIWIYEDDSDVQIVDEVMAVFDSITGLYMKKVQLTAVAGFEAGKCYTVLIRATVDSVAAHTTHNFQIQAAVNVDAAGIRGAVGLASANLDTQLAALPTTAELEARTILAADYVVTTDTVAAVTTVGSVTGAVGSVTGNVGGNVTGSIGSISGITFPTNFSDLAITVTNGYVTVGTNNDKTGYTASTVSDKTGYSLAADQSAVTIGTVSALTGHTAQTGDTYALANGVTGFAAIDTVVDTILDDTNELQTDWENGGRLDLLLDACSTHDAAAVITAMKASTGWTAGGTYQLDKVVRAIAAAVCGDVSDDPVSGLNYKDIEDGSTDILDLTTSTTTPYSDYMVK